MSGHFYSSESEDELDLELFTLEYSKVRGSIINKNMHQFEFKSKIKDIKRRKKKNENIIRKIDFKKQYSEADEIERESGDELIDIKFGPTYFKVNGQI